MMFGLIMVDYDDLVVFIGDVLYFVGEVIWIDDFVMVLVVMLLGYCVVEWIFVCVVLIDWFWVGV